ncbi:retinitis pigmentosa 1-like 1 protein [Hyperolius riggenbachi]|uniref:retinitis pigmentosa 1-like 1 protein n=1 Tax=Hyperolius riggenbachi TaxID=752182 RepID=UPI0035A39399
MNSVTADGFPPSPGRPFPPVSRPHAVSEVPPAKKITFYKSGDPQFSGVKLAINRRSFKSFSALMDDLSNRVPLPFGVRTITTPRGTHCINRLDQLQDGGSYICSDKKYVQPITGRKAGAHRVSRPVSARKQGQQDEAEEEYSATHFQQVPKLRKKIVLVKNGDPTVRRSILLNRRNARNFKTFLEDASDLLHFTVRRIYTMDGKRVENIQAVLHSPSILICGGREPFKPIQSENVHKSTTEKLPGLRSQHNGNSEVMDNKKNANFGLKAKKSVIHPRSASSNKTRFSLSSEKSYPNGANMSPANSGFASSPHGKSEDTAHSLVNDDIEKKVHVNKDGSLSVEMKVRFRLLNEETLQWSTQIKKSGKGKCEQLYLCDENDKKENPETYSETDESFYPCDADSYSSKLNDADLEDMYCEHCGMQCQDYDIWKNPMHVNTNPKEDYVKRATWQTQSTASSTSSHHKLACEEKTSAGSLHSMSSEEYTEHVLHKSTCYSETRENGETTIRYSMVSQCTSRSGQSSAASDVDVSSDKPRKNTGDSQHRSCSSHRSQTSLHSQHSEGQTNLKSQGGSFEDCNETSPTPCSGGEFCSQRVSAVSQSSLRSRTSRKSLLKRSSTHSKSFGSNISYKEDEEEDETSAKATLKNMLGISTENEASEQHSGSECTQQPEATNELNTTDGKENGGHATPDVTLGSNSSECDKCSTKSSCHSKTSSKRNGRNKSCGQNNDQVSCSSPALSDVSKQNREKMLNHQESLETCEATTADGRSSCSKMSRKSYGESRGQSIQSNQSLKSMPPLAEPTLAHELEDQQVIDQEESCKEIPESYHERESENCTAATVDENDLASPPISRSSSKSESFSSKCNNISCPEKDKNYSLSSRVSSAAENKSKPVSPEVSDQNSSKGSAREMSQNSQEDEKPTDQRKASETCSKISGCDANGIHSPSPPKDKPVNRHLRSSQYKYSSASLSSDPMKNMNGEKMGSSRSSTPASKGMMASKTSIETCKMLKNAASCNSTEDILNTKKRKNSSSSTKRKLKGGSLDSESHNELIPSALPNVTPEEVVNEWLKKIPSETMAVEYEVEECQKKVSMENEASKMDSDKADIGEVNEVVTEIQANDQAEKVTDVGDINTINETEFTNLCDKVENDERFLANNLKTNSENNNAVTVESTCNKKIFPNHVHTSVQIMKALLNPLQESKFDRSNSLPEVSRTMGRKLSNSAKVLISCLASLHLLDDGPKDPTKIPNDLNTPKYIELLNIFQALWSEGPNSKSITSMKSVKHYSREDELTPVSSSGVDINSGYGGSGDGSITGGGDNMVTTEKSEDNKLTAVAEEVECTAKSIPQCVKKPSISADQDDDISQPPTSEAVDAGFDEAKPCVMDENMNEKKVGNSFDRDVEDTAVKHENSDPMNIVNNEHTETAAEQSTSMSDTMNIHSHSGNETKSNESNSQETNCINSPSECPSTIISTSDSNGKNDPISNNLGGETDPVWVLKLLKKIEKEFMTHYVNAMNEFKVRWNLEDNENLDEMILELKNEVSQRIQKSISNELKKIKSRAANKVPRPPDDGPRRKSSLLAEERRRRLQALHRKSIHNYISSENKDGGTNDSCETDEEDLTFSASFADDSSGLANDDFCPCDKCIRQKRALKLARPKPPAVDAPIIKAFDLQQILKIKREQNEANDNGAIVSSVQECKKDEESATGKDCSNGGKDEEPTECEADKVKITESDILEQENQDNECDIQEDISVVEKSEVCETEDLQCEAMHEEQVENKDSEVENKSPGDLADEIENVNTEESDKISTGVEEKQLSIDCPQDDHNTAVSGEVENKDSEVENKSSGDLADEIENVNTEESDNISTGVEEKQLSIDCPQDDHNTAVSEEENQNKQEDCLEDLGEKPGQEVASEHEETAEVSDSEGEPHLPDNGDAMDKCPENGDCHEEKKSDNPVINTEEDSESEESETVESHSSCIQKSCLGQASLITQNGSAEEPEEECKEVNNSLGETSPNGHSNGSDSKKSQMYPESSEEEDGDSPRASPVGITKSVSTGKVCVNNKESFEDHESKKGLEDDVLDQDDFDF